MGAEGKVGPVSWACAVEELPQLLPHTCSPKVIAASEFSKWLVPSPSVCASFDSCLFSLPPILVVSASASEMLETCSSSSLMMSSL